MFDGLIGGVYWIVAAINREILDRKRPLQKHYLIEEIGLIYFLGLLELLPGT